MKFLYNDWHGSEEGEPYLELMFEEGYPLQRKIFGLLERPVVPSSLSKKQPDVYTCKIAMVGKAGCGKSLLLSNITGLGYGVYMETPGIHTGSAYWPAKTHINDRVVLFHLDLWDVGQLASRMCPDLTPACMEGAMVVLLVFSLSDHDSFKDVATRLDGLGEDSGYCRIVVGTNSSNDVKVSSEEMTKLSATYGVKILMAPTVSAHQCATMDEYLQTYGQLCNQICDLAMTHHFGDPQNDSSEA